MLRAVAIALALGGCVSKPTVYRDTIRPGGVERGQAELMRDSSACDFATNALRPGVHFDTLHDQCLGGRGWVSEGSR